jgi:hypothetical protein
MLLLGESPPKIFDEGSHAGVAGESLGQSLGIFERSRDISGITGEAN